MTTAFGGTVRDEHPPADLPVSRSARLLRATRVLVGRDGLRGRRAYSGREQYFNGRDETVWDELAHPELVVHGVHLLRGAAEAKAFYARLHAAFPDWHATIEDLLGEGDRVALRITESGTLQGSFLGLTATGKRFEISALQICRLQDGKLVEMWGARDTAAMLRQLSGASTPAAAG